MLPLEAMLWPKATPPGRACSVGGGGTALLCLPHAGRQGSVELQLWRGSCPLLRGIQLSQCFPFSALKLCLFSLEKGAQSSVSTNLQIVNLFGFCGFGLIILCPELSLPIEGRNNCEV